MVSDKNWNKCSTQMVHDQSYICTYIVAIVPREQKMQDAIFIDVI